MNFFKSLTPEFQCILFLLYPVPEVNLVVKTVFPLVVENVILPAQGSSDTSILKAIQDLVLPFICVLLRDKVWVGRLSCHPVAGEGTSVLQSILSPCWPALISMEVLLSVSVLLCCPLALRTTPTAPASPTARGPWGPSPLRTLQPLWGSGTLGWKWIHLSFMGPAIYTI